MNNVNNRNTDSSAYGGSGWSPRLLSHRQEIGQIWNSCGLNNEWAILKRVLLHRPGKEITQLSDANAVQMFEVPDSGLAGLQHDALCKAYTDAGVEVLYVDPITTPPVNMMFCADLFFMTPEGAILARPASTVRAGEEIFVAQRLINANIPIVASLFDTATFEGADAIWIDAETVFLARGLRTNQSGFEQVKNVLFGMGVEVIPIELPYGTMHLMGQLRFLDRDLALVWPYRFPYTAIQVLEERGIQVMVIPDEKEASVGAALNFVTLGPRKIIMPTGNPITQDFVEKLGVTCITVDVQELIKAAGGIGCLTGILERELI